MLNAVFLIGNLVADPEIRAIQNGKKVAKLRLAVDQSRRGPSGDKIEKTLWISCTAWDRLADICDRFLRKGNKIAIRGSLDYQEWKAQDGSKRSKIEVIIREMEMLTPRPVDGRPPQREAPSYPSNASEEPYDPMTHFSSGTEDTPYVDDFSSNPDDNIPF